MGGGRSGKVDPAKTAMSLSPDSVPLLTPCAPDPKIANLDWNVDDIVYVWMRMLRMCTGACTLESDASARRDWFLHVCVARGTDIFSAVNSIKDANVHAAAIAVLTDVINILLQAEHAIPYQMTLDESLPKPLSLINIFGPWLFDACQLNSYVAIANTCDHSSAL
jgi:hypothetical protein